MEKRMTKSETKAGEDWLLDRAFHLAGRDTHKPVDLQSAWRELGLTIEQMRRLLCSLVEQGYLLASERPASDRPASDEPASGGPGRMALFLEAHGFLIQVRQTDAPGIVIHADEWQVAAIPTRYPLHALSRASSRAMCKG